MNDERLLQEVGSWLRAGDPEPPDAHQSVQHAMERMPQVRQRSRWWPFPVFYRRTQTPTPTDTTEYQPSHIPASNGHTPTVIGRTTSMLSPVKAITAGAIVFAVGGVMLIAQPFQQQGTVPGAATDEAPAAPVEFTGKIALGPCTGPSEIQPSGGRTRTLSADRGRYCEPPVIEPFSDPRLVGDYYVWQNNDVYAGGPTIWATAFSIVTDEGAWRGIPDVFLDEEASGDQILVGEGAYDGLTAIATVDMEGEIWSWHGWIVDGDLPPLPAEPEAIP